MGALCEEAIAMRRQGPDWSGDTRAGRAGWPPWTARSTRRSGTSSRLCLKLLLQQQPVARDLRQISAALKMITDMERIGDQAAGHRRDRPTFLKGRGRRDHDDILRQMARATISMVTDSVDAFVKQDQ